MAELIFWVALLGLFYIYAGYPLLLAALARWRPAPVTRAPTEARVSVLIAVHNDAARLGPKVRSLLAADGSGCLLEVLIGSDGSSDDPAAAVAALGDARVQVIAFPERRGKPSVLNDLAARARGDWLLMMDARQLVDERCLLELTSCFADARVGVVSGELVFRRADTDSTAARGVDAYWRYEKFIRRCEGRFRSVPGATGAVYAVRRELFRPIPAETLLDDVAIPLQAVAQGYRCIFCSEAQVYDRPSENHRQESIRKRRTIAGVAQLPVLFPWLLAPGRNPIWFEFVSHKLLRLVSPFLLVALAAGAWVGADQPLLRASGWGQLAFYALALAGAAAQRFGLRSGLMGVPYMFVVLNLTTLAALGDALRRRHRVTWAASAPGTLD